MLTAALTCTGLTDPATSGPLHFTPAPTSAGFSLLYFRVAIAVIGGQADLRPALSDYLLLAAACCGTM